MFKRYLVSSRHTGHAFCSHACIHKSRGCAGASHSVGEEGELSERGALMMFTVSIGSFFCEVAKR